MFRRNPIRFLHHLVYAVTDNDLAIILPCLPCDVRGWQDRKQAFYFTDSFTRELLGISQQHCWRTRSVLSLSQQVGRTDLAVDAFVGNYQCLGWPGKQIDTDTSEQLPLGLGYVGISGPDYHVNRLDSFGPERHRRHSLHPAQYVDFVRASKMHRGDDGR